jgi:hypothetical protein
MQCMRYICDSCDSYSSGIGRVAALSYELTRTYICGGGRFIYLPVFTNACRVHTSFFSAGIVLATGIIAIKTPVSKRKSDTKTEPSSKDPSLQLGDTLL